MVKRLIYSVSTYIIKNFSLVMMVFISGCNARDYTGWEKGNIGWDSSTYITKHPDNMKTRFQEKPESEGIISSTRFQKKSDKSSLPGRKENTPDYEFSTKW